VGGLKSVSGNPIGKDTRGIHFQKAITDKYNAAKAIVTWNYTKKNIKNQPVVLLFCRERGIFYNL